MNSASSERRRLPAVALALAAGLAVSAWALGCTESEWPDRDPLIVDRVPVDSLEFLPPGARFSLVDSLTHVRFRFRAGYADTRVQILDLEERPSNPPPGFAARIRLELPENADGPIETSARDSVLLKRFPQADGPTLRLLDSLGAVLDSTALVRGTLAYDSLTLVSPATSTSRYRFYYRDTVGALPRNFSADSLSSCEFLNHAEFERNKDTVTVRYSWVTLDPDDGNDSCRGELHTDALDPLPSRP